MHYHYHWIKLLGQEETGFDYKAISMLKKNRDASSPLHPTTYLKTLLHLFESMQTLIQAQPTLCQYSPLDMTLAKEGIFDRPVVAREVQLLH